MASAINSCGCRGAAQPHPTVPDHAGHGANKAPGPAKTTGSASSPMQATHQAAHGVSVLDDGKIEHMRSAPEDRARAQRVLEANMEIFGDLRYEDTAPSRDDKPNGDHRDIPPAKIKEFQARFPDLPVPREVVYNMKTMRVNGVVYANGKSPADLGLGAMHQHRAGGGYMQHVWFTPGDLELAYSDVMRRDEVRSATR